MSVAFNSVMEREKKYGYQRNDAIEKDLFFHIQKKAVFQKVSFHRIKTFEKISEESSAKTY